MKPHLSKSITLIELLIAIVLMTLIVLSFASIELFNRYHVLTADRRAQVQNEVSYILDHMSSKISMAVGDVRPNKFPLVTNEDVVLSIKTALFYPDYNRDGLRNDSYESYGHNAIEHRFWFCKSPTNFACYIGGLGALVENLSSRITNVNWTYIGNYLDVELTGCWDPAQPSSLDNPQFTMRTRIMMPSVSTN